MHAAIDLMQADAPRKSVSVECANPTCVDKRAVGDIFKWSAMRLSILRHRTKAVYAFVPAQLLSSIDVRLMDANSVPHRHNGA